MPTYREIHESLYVILYEGTKFQDIAKIKKWADEAGIKDKHDVVDFVLTTSERLKDFLNKKNDNGDKGERIEDISYAFTKISPKAWLDQMKGSSWYNAGCPGLYEEKIEQAKDTINGIDKIASSPAMQDLTWREVKDYGRDGFLVIMIKKFQEFNRKYEYLKR